MRLIQLGLALTLGLSACLKDETISGQTKDRDTWVLQTLNGKPVTSRITISFSAQGMIAGQGPCNRYSAAQSAPLPWFEISAIRATKMACKALALEATYFDALTASTLIEHRANSLLLTNDQGGTLLFHLE